MNDERKYKYQHHEPLCVVEPTYDHNGNPRWESMCTPADFKVRALCLVPSHLPGLIIFVHGVNSEGEWYDFAEEALCNGLNERLGRTDDTCKDKLKPISYDPAGKDGKPVARKAIYKDDITPRSSPVIRFYWGYRAPDDEKYKYRVPLRNLQGDDLNDPAAARPDPRPGPWYWGGGAFQNGCNALPMLWRKWGFKKWQQIGPVPVSTQAVNTEVDRQLENAPPRHYYAHAANRLAKLIKRIRDNYPHDTVTVMSHSQGTMVSLAAAAIEAPDALFLMNSPYALDDKVTDTMGSGDVRSTERARQHTLVNIVNKVAANANRLRDAEAQGRQLYVGACTDSDGLICGWRPAETVHRRADGSEIKERDNHGRTYVYFNPHDRVMGLSPLQSLGWQGVPDDDKKRKVWEPCKGKLFQRMLARSTPCGGEPNPKTPFGTLPDMLPAVDKPAGKPYWDGNQRAARIGPEVWTKPKANQTVNINAEEVPQPLRPEELASFDQDKETPTETDGEFGKGWGQLDPDNNNLPRDENFRYYASIYQRQEYIYDPTLPPRGKHSGQGGYRLETQEEMQARIKRYVQRPTDHSTLPMHQPFLQRVVAYDLPIGHCDAGYDLNFLLQLRHDADWVQPGADDYWQNGTLEIPPIPPEIDQETVADESQAKAQQHGKY